MTIPTNRKRHPHTDYIHITGHGSSESGEPFVRMEIKGKSILVRVNNLLGARNVEFARLQKIGANLLDPGAQKELIARIEAARRAPESFSVATTLGWHGKAFVFPDGVVPKGWSDVEIYLDDDHADIYRARPPNRVQRQIHPISRFGAGDKRRPNVCRGVRGSSRRGGGAGVARQVCRAGFLQILVHARRILP
jgi:hypothetical protein